MISEIQKNTAEAIVNIFETGLAAGDYGNVTVVRGDPGHLTYGRSQTTLASGNLFLLVKAYVDAPEASFAEQLRPYLPRLMSRDLSLDDDTGLHAILRQAGGDPMMREQQDAFFDRIYWAPAQIAAEGLGIASALGCCVVYDSTVHGSFELIRDQTNAQLGRVGARDGGERDWIARYVTNRREWLATRTNQLLQKTVYRMDALQRIINTGNWDLTLPLTVRGILIDESVLGGHSARVSARVVEVRTLMLDTPMLRGDDVAAVQRAIVAEGADLAVDGIFGSDTDRAVRQCQAAHGLTVDGIVGPATRAVLGL